MKPTDFAYRVSTYLSTYLPGVQGLSTNTVMSYRDMFKLLIEFYEKELDIKADRIMLHDLTRTSIERFLDWLETDRGCSVSTRNVRLAAVHAFARYLQRELPEFMFQSQQLLSIPIKKTKAKSVDYLTLEEMKFLLSLPNTSTRDGRRDSVLLSLLYDTGARVQELCDLVVSDVKIGPLSTVKLTGKGSKSRLVPIMKSMSNLLNQYLKENGLTEPGKSEYPVFHNRSNAKLTREGVAYIIGKYVSLAETISPGMLPKRVSPHCFRHSKAMHLLQSGVNLIYIRDLLGHVDIKTTEVYARIDGEMKRKALERSTAGVVSDKLPEWQTNTELMAWLKSLGK
ncbi:MAG: site-specific integrase [Alicyclobacillus sp.]|nr:site-specific integrase [Alicyclobacillus sp.]